MAEVRKYLFDLRFDEHEGNTPRAANQTAADEPADEEEDLPLPPAPMFSEDELAHAREQSFDAGRRVGQEEAARSAEQLAVNALEHLAAGLADLARSQAEFNDTVMRSAVQVALTVTRKVLPATARQNASAEIETLVQECVAGLLDEPRVQVRVHPELMEPLRPRLEQVASEVGFEGRLTVTADPRLGPDDCRIEWGGGGAERSQERLWHEIETVVARAIGGPAKDAPAAALMGE